MLLLLEKSVSLESVEALWRICACSDYLTACNGSVVEVLVVVLELLMKSGIDVEATLLGGKLNLII